MINRRSILKIGAFSAFGGLFNRIIADEEKTSKSCIFIYLQGGASHIETISPIMNAPIEFRSTTGSVRGYNGIELGGTFEKLILHSDKFNIVKSFSTNDNNHNSSQHWLFTSHPSQRILEGSAQVEPCYGSIISALEGPNTKSGMPSYVKLNTIAYDKSAWLGATHIGYEPNGELSPTVSLDKFRERIAIVNELERYNSIRGQSLPQSWSDLRNQAARVISGNIADAFKIDKEDPKIVQKYDGEKNNSFGQRLLIARRLVEHGCKFVSIVNFGWDMHTSIKDGFGRGGPELDGCVSALVSDLYERGLNKDCMVIVTTEFGRTSKINIGGGRDHQSGIIPLIISGGDYEQGRVIGSHDDRAFRPTSKPITPFDLSATIFDHFGFKKDMVKTDNSGRPRFLLPEGECIL